jgi:hypothetical protein
MAGGYIALICACLPPLRPLLVQYVPSLSETATSRNDTHNNFHETTPWGASLQHNDSCGVLVEGPPNPDKRHRRSESMSRIVRMWLEKEVGTSVSGWDADAGVEREREGGGDGDGRENNEIRIYIERKIVIDDLRPASSSSAMSPLGPNKELPHGSSRINSITEDERQVGMEAAREGD